MRTEVVTFLRKNRVPVIDKDYRFIRQDHVVIGKSESPDKSFSGFSITVDAESILLTVAIKELGL